MSKNKDVQYTTTYKEKRKSKRVVIDLYLDNEQELIIHQFLETSDNKKEYILDLIKKDLNIS